MQGPKIQLSSAEAELMLNAEIILTKNTVLRKMTALLEAVRDRQLKEAAVSGLARHDIFSVSPKISRGEQYLGLPWLMLDHPRSSAGNQLFFIRCMFWWGNFFSCTLHLSGSHAEAKKSRIASNYEQLREFYIGIHSDPWEHHFGKENYAAISEMTRLEFEETCMRQEHLKIGISWPLNEWMYAEDRLTGCWKKLLEVCGLIT
jgi:hypothetical protein